MNSHAKEGGKYQDGAEWEVLSVKESAKVGVDIEPLIQNHRGTVCATIRFLRTQISSYFLAPLKWSKVEVLSEQVWEFLIQGRVQIKCMIHNQEPGRMVKKS